jgi:hypothetical protein
MKADEQLRLARRQDVNGVGIPNLVEQRAAFCHEKNSPREKS